MSDGPTVVRAIPWCPRQMPRMGILASAITSAQIPKSSDFSGDPGPGEITTLSNSSRAPMLQSSQSLGTMTGGQPLTSVR